MFNYITRYIELILTSIYIKLHSSLTEATLVTQQEVTLPFVLQFRIRKLIDCETDT